MNPSEFENQTAEDRRLRAELASLREAYSEEEAPSSTEEELLLKFRQMKSTPRRTLLVWARWPLAAAAALLLVCGLGLWLASRAIPEPHRQRQAAREPVRAGNVTAESRTDRIVRSAEQVPAAAKPRARKHAASPVARHSARQVANSERARRPDPDAFIPTMFPIVGDADYGLQLVRVELPRRTMMSFGFPVNSREMDRPVKADLIIGPDGLTRAIRFVQ